MVIFMDSLRAVIKSSGISIPVISEKTGISVSTIREILSGKGENPRLQTVEDILSVTGGRIIIETEQSKQAIATQDVSWYREEMHKKDVKIDKLEEELADLKVRLRTRNNTIDELIHKYVLCGKD